MNKKKILISLALFLCVEAVLLSLLFWGKEKAEQRYVERVLAYTQAGYNSNVACFARLADFADKEIFGRPEAVDLFARAVQGGREEREHLRRQLYELLLPSYKVLAGGSFRQVHYHLADGTSFLRLHLPERFGDNLLPYRPSVRIANSEQRPVEGFEIGRDYHAFRHVFPLRKNGVHLGTVEVSEPFYVVSKALRQVYPGEYYLILRKALLEERLLPKGMENYVGSTLADGYLQEKADLVANFKGHDHEGHLDPALIDRLNTAIRKKIPGQLATGKAFARSVIDGGNDYLVCFLPLDEVGGESAGYLISYVAEPVLASLRHGYVIAHLLATVLLILLFGLHIRATRKIAGQLSFQRQLMEAIPTPVCLKDKKGVFTLCNQAFAELFRQPKEKIIGQRNADLIDPVAAGQQQSLDGVVLATGKSQQEELHLPYADGSSRDLVVFKAPFVDERGAIVGVIGSAFDLTERKKMEDAVARAHAELDQIFNTAANGMRVVDLSHTVVRANHTFYLLTGLSEKEVIGRKCYEVFPGFACHTEQCPLDRISENPQRLEFEITKILPSGRKLECAVTSTPHYGPNGELIGIIEDFKDISRYKELEQLLRDAAITDELTGLFNRRGFLTLAEKQMQNAERMGQEIFLLFADLDKMKEINDSLGHDAGDLALKSIADILRDTFREGDVVARLGGDEFACLIFSGQGIDREQAIVSRLESNIRKVNAMEALPFVLSLSVGAIRRHNQQSLEEMMLRADALMYENKARKKESE